jgi:hypothetical protein
VSFPVGGCNVVVVWTVVAGSPESAGLVRLHALSRDAASITSSEIRTDRDIDTSADRLRG